MQAKEDLLTRSAIELMVNLFYTKARQDEFLARVFNTRIMNEEQWAHHFIVLSNFWETVIFAKPAYRGNPFPRHQGLQLTPAHFDRWISLFQETVDENFSGGNASSFKEKVNKMRLLFEAKLFPGTGELRSLI